MPLYFAYGSNMSPAQMQRRCPGARAVGAASLDGWRFIIPAGRGANIVTRPDGIVHGVLWRLSPENLTRMDAWEGTAVGAYRRRLVAVQCGARRIAAITYVSDRRWPGVGRTDYMLTAVLPGARAFDLPAAYQDELAGWLGVRPIGPQRVTYRGRRKRPVAKRASRR